MDLLPIRPISDIKIAIPENGQHRLQLLDNHAFSSLKRGPRRRLTI
jgi:hypothetical protein